MKTKFSVRKHLSITSMLEATHNAFSKIPEHTKRTSCLSLTDCLMSGLALFGLKYPSLLQFDKDARKSPIQHNLKSLYKISQVPSDTYMRERLDKVEPRYLQKALDKIINQLQRGKVLEQYQYMEEKYYLVPIDGSGYFSSHEIHCASCCEKHHRDGGITYYHQMLAAVMVRPGYRSVFPLAIEPIQKEDGASKNDCEHNAASRLLKNLRSQHPHLNMVLVLDALYADGPTLKLIKELGFHFIVTAKSNDLKYLFEAYQASEKKEIIEGRDGEVRHYNFANDLPLNDKHSDFKVNVLECFEEIKGDKHYFCWATDLPLTESKLVQIAKGGRARWKIENETFNTLKNQGYQFEHNFGHGYEHLSTVLAYLMFLAFLIDQVQEFCCKYFKAALAQCTGRRHLWQKLQGLFFTFLISSWPGLFEALVRHDWAPSLEGSLDSS